MITSKINSYLSTNGKIIEQAILDEVAHLAQNAFIRQFGQQEEREGGLRLSAIGKCMRQQAYNLLGYEANGKTIDSRAKMVFFQGDLAEMAIVLLAKVAGCSIYNSGLDQVPVAIDGIVGHPDGAYADHTEDKTIEGYLLEVKSMSSYAFADFERGELDEGYIYQINAYMEATGLDKAIVVALNKDAGVLGQKIVHKDLNICADIKKRIATLKALEIYALDNEVIEDDLPLRPYEANEKGIYPWNCLYCAHHKTCRPHAEKVLVGKSYKLKELKND